MTEPRLPLTALVVSRDEADDLRRCLPTIAFCEQIVVVDLESTDETAAVAADLGARVVTARPVPTVERARLAAVEHVGHDWVLLTDPDEELPGRLAARIGELLESVDDDVALVYAPIEYRFGNRALRGTVWGGLRERRLLVRLSGAELSGTIFAGVRTRDGYRAISLPRERELAIRHRWVDGYRDFIAKHRRYIAAGAEDRARAGEITGWRAIARTPFVRFHESYVRRAGYQDGLVGLALSLLWAWYSTSSELALKRRLR